MTDPVRSNQLWLLFGYISSIVAMLYLRDVEGVAIPKLAFVGVVISASVLANYRTLLSVILFTLPLLSGLPGNYLLPIWSILVLFHQISRHTLNPWALAFTLLFVVWEFAIYAFYPFNVELMDTIAYFSSLLILCLLVAEKGRVDYRTPVTLFCLGCSVLLVIIFVIYVSDPTLMITDGGTRMGGDSYVNEGKMTLRTNANILGYMSVSSISCLLTLFYYKKIHLLPFLALVIVSFICGMYSISRTWAILTFVTFALYFNFQKKDRKIGYVVFALFVGIIAWLFANNEAILSVFIDRFTGDNIATGGERTTLFAAYNNFLFENLGNLFWGTSAQLYRQVADITSSTHNSLQQIWLSYGVIGFVIFMLSYWRLIRMNYVRREFLACLPMFVIVLFLQTIQLLNPYNGMYPLIAAFFIMRMIKTDHENGQLYIK